MVKIHYNVMETYGGEKKVEGATLTIKHWKETFYQGLLVVKVNGILYSSTICIVILTV